MSEQVQLTETEREEYVCCVKRALCKDEHYHQRDIEAIVAGRLARVEALADEFDGIYGQRVARRIRAALSAPTPAAEGDA